MTEQFATRWDQMRVCLLFAYHEEILARPDRKANTGC